MMGKGDMEVVRHGRWSSGGIHGHVWIVRQDWDYFHEEFYDDGPDLSEDGWAFYALYGTKSDVAQHTSRSPTCTSEAEAVRRAEASVEHIEWDLRS